jgi:hypothetical protein
LGPGFCACFREICVDLQDLQQLDFEIRLECCLPMYLPGYARRGFEISNGVQKRRNPLRWGENAPISIQLCLHFVQIRLHLLGQ